MVYSAQARDGLQGDMKVQLIRCQRDVVQGSEDDGLRRYVVLIRGCRGLDVDFVDGLGGMCIARLGGRVLVNFGGGGGVLLSFVETSFQVGARGF
jgi:hypothetical protein